MKGKKLLQTPGPSGELSMDELANLILDFEAEELPLEIQEQIDKCRQNPALWKRLRAATQVILHNRSSQFLEENRQVAGLFVRSGLARPEELVK